MDGFILDSSVIGHVSKQSCTLVEKREEGEKEDRKKGDKTPLPFSACTDAICDERLRSGKRGAGGVE